jgi:tripartite ATP-independent transporter DctP family solute receptor
MHIFSSAPTRRSLLRAAGASAALAAPMLHGAAAADVKRIRYAHSAPVAHGWHIWGVQFKQSLEQRTGGKIQVVIYPNAQMGTERDIAQAVRVGSLEMGAVGVALMNWVPDMSITDAPFLFPTRPQAYAALDGALGNELKRRSLAQGFRLTGWTDLGYRVMTNNKHQIGTVADMRDLKMRVPDSKSYIAMMQATGASIVTVDLSELYLALRQGVADGQETPPSVIKSNKYYEVQKYLARTNHILTTAYTVTNPAAFEALSADEQTAFVAAADDATKYLRDYTQKDEEASFAFLKDKGMQLNLAVDVESFRTVCTAVWAKFPELFRPDLLKLAQA